MKCENCVHKEIRCFPETANDYDDLGEIVNKCVYFNGWIPVSERLPDTCTDVLVTYKNGDIAVDFISYENEWFWEDETEGCVVTAWQPLPEPYQP